MQQLFNRAGWITATALALLVLAALAGVVRGGPLDPSAPPGSTLPQDEPRKPIDHVPYTISSSGSYFLTKNASGLATTGNNGITISSNDVTLDLNGFSVVGTSADGNTVCGCGITVSLNPAHNIVIRNGVVRDWNYGLAADNTHDSRVEDIRAYNNRHDGIRAAAGTTVTDCTSSGNGDNGIVSFGGTVSHCTAQGNTKNGIYVTDIAEVSDCVASGNSQNGVETDVGSANFGGVIRHCVINNNQQSGIDVRTSVGVIEDNLVQNNSLAGLSTSRANILVENSGGNNIIRGNRLSESGWDLVFALGTGGNLAIANFIGGNTFFDPGNSNSVGPFVQVSTDTNPSGNYGN